MTPQQQIIDCIAQSRAKGMSDDSIKTSLVTAGWQEGDVVSALATPSIPVSIPPVPVVSAVYAGFWHRVAASLADYIILTAAFLLVAFGISIIAGASAMSTGPVSLVIFALQFAGWFFYYPYMEAKKGATFGKRFIGITVVRDNSETLTLARSFGRNIAKILSAIIFGIGFLMVAFTSKKQGLHDKLAKCVLLKTERTNPYRSALVIILGTLGPALFLIFVVPLLLAGFIGAMLFGGVSSFEQEGFEMQLDESYDPDTFLTADVSREELDNFFATTSILALKDSDEAALLDQGYVQVGPAIVAWSPMYYDMISVYLHDFPGIYITEYVSVTLKEVIDIEGKDVLDHSAEESPLDEWTKTYSYEGETVLMWDMRKPFQLVDGADGESITKVSGTVNFKVPLSDGQFYEKSYDFFLEETY